MRTFANGVLAVVVFSMTACLDLDVTNDNLPDRQRALAEPADVENVIKSAFLIWYNRFSSSDLREIYPLLADEMTQTISVRGILWASEPREALKNDPLAQEVWIPRAPWDGFNGAAANTIDGLVQIVKNGMKIITLDPGATATTDNTDRAYAFAKFMQGTALGYAALTMDQSVPATEENPVPTGYDEAIQYERTNLKPYTEVMKTAIQSLEEGIARIDASIGFTLGPDWINGQTYTHVQLRQVMNTMIARLLVYNARTPEERQAVDWAKVLKHTAEGVTFDFGPTLATGVLTSTYLDRAQGTSRMRADYRLIGPADVSGNYQTWLATPRNQQTRFNITTPDRRITGNTPTSSGAYFRYRQPTDNSGNDPSRGEYMISSYQWYRRSGSATTGQHVILSVDENRLLRAEAMFRTNNPGEAANLINVSRTRTVRIGSTNHPGLPAVTTNGVPPSATCVPRTVTGSCGSLLDALKYERQIELAGQDPMRAWHDFRGFGQLQPGTILHMPVPARYLVQLGLPLYSFGGVGGNGAAK